MTEHPANELSISMLSDCKKLSAAIATKRALTAEEAKRIFDLSLEIVCITNLEGEVLLANPAYEKILGYTAEDAAQTPLLTLIHPEDSDRAMKGLASLAHGALVEPTSPSSDIRFIARDGTVKWIQWTAVPILEENKLFAIGRDLTGQKIAEAQNQELAAIVQASSEAIFGVDNKNLIKSWNQGAERLYGYSADQVLERNVALLVCRDNEKDFFGLLDECRKGEYLESIECLHFDKCGAPVETAVSLAPVKDEFGAVSRISIIARNIAHQRAAQKRIAEFYSMVSHELRTPLASIRGVLGLLEGGLIEPSSEEAADLVKIARASCDRLVRLVNDILDLRKIESGNFELELEPLSPRDLMSLAVDSTKSLTQESDITITSQVDVEERIFGDRGRLIQVLVNLISNAVKFSPPGSTVRLSVSRVNNAAIRFAVSDCGLGISAEDKCRLFQKFQPLDSGDTRSKPGVGLGLAIAKSIIDRHGGKLDVDSTPGSGSTFWFELAGLDDCPKQA